MNATCSLTSVRVLEDLAGDEDGAHREGQVHPLDDAPLAEVEEAAGAAGLQALGGEHAELAGDRRQHQDDRVRERVRDVELGGLIGPQLGRGRPQREVDREQAGEEHHLAAEPDDHADLRDVRPVDHRSLRGGDRRGRSRLHYGRYLRSVRSTPCRPNSPGPPFSPNSSRAPICRSPRRRGRWRRSWADGRLRRSSAAFLVALRAKGETVGEIVGFRDAVLANARPLPVDPMALDIVGTGGDRFGTVNVSTMASVVAAAAGAPRRQARQQGGEQRLRLVGRALRARHRPDDRRPSGSRRSWMRWASRSPSPRCSTPASRTPARSRAELGIPTVFNFLGPLCNPARPEASARRRRPARQGAAVRRRVPDPRRDRAGVPGRRRARRAVDHGAQPRLGDLARRGARARPRSRRPRAARARRSTTCSAATPTTNAAIARRMLAGEEGPVRDIVLLNAAAGLVSWELAQDAALAEQDIRARFREQLARAAAVVDSGEAIAKLDAWVAATPTRRRYADVVVDPVEGPRDGLLPDRAAAARARRRPSAAPSGVSSCQFARSSSRSFQNPTASPAA